MPSSSVLRVDAIRRESEAVAMLDGDAVRIHRARRSGGVL